MVDAHQGFGGGLGLGSVERLDRLPKLYAAGLILVMSLATWGVIALGVSLVVG